MRSLLVPLVLSCLLSAGCYSGPKPVRPPKVHPKTAAAAAIEAYDTDGDERLNQEELAACPGLLEGMSKYDENEDGTIDPSEITQRLETLYSNGVGMLNLGCRVMSRGRPIPDCNIRLVPESFLGGAVKPAVGTTRESGTAMLRIAPEDLPSGLENVRGVHSGVYRAELSHASSSVTKLIEKSGPYGFDVSVDDQVQGLTIELGR